MRKDTFKLGVSQEEAKLKNLARRFCNELSDLLEERGDDRGASQVFWCERSGSYRQFILDGARKYKSLHCKKGFCPICQRRTSAIRLGNLEKIAEKLNADKSEFYQGTISPKNCEDIGEGLRIIKELIEKTFGSHTRQRFFNREGVRASTLSLEITRNRENGSWHPHLHFILWIDRSKDKENLFGYQEFTVGNGQLFNRWAFDVSNHLAKLGFTAFVTCSPLKTFYEGVKYAIKPNCADSDKSTGLRPWEALQAWDAIKENKMKTFRTYGGFRKLKGDGLDDADLFSHGTEYLEFSFGFKSNDYWEMTDGEVHQLTEDEIQQAKERQALKALKN